MPIFDENRNQLDIYDVCEWIVTEFDKDIFVEKADTLNNNIVEGVTLREFAKTILELRHMREIITR